VRRPFVCALVLFLLTAAVVSAAAIDEAAEAVEHMAGDVEKAKTVTPAEARALAREVAEHAEQAEKTLEPLAIGAAKDRVDAAIAALGKVNTAAQAVQRASDGDVRARVTDLETAYGALVPAFAAARAAAATTLPRTGGPLSIGSPTLVGLVLVGTGLLLRRRHI